MSNILSQDEIDELLMQLAGGDSDEAAAAEPEEPQYKVHDFKTANKFSKEHMRTLNGIFDNFAYLLSTRMTGMLRTVVDVKVTSIEELIFSEFNNAIATPVILAVIDAPPLKGSIMMQLSMPIAYALVVRLLGGVADYMVTEKNFTEIELSVIESMIDQMLRVFAESWKRVIAIQPRLQHIETSPQFAQICAMNEPTALVTLNVKIDRVEEIIAFCIPHYVIQPISKRLNTMLWNFSDAHHDEDSKSDVLTRHLEDSNVTLSATLDRKTMSLEDILWLRPGDVLCLDQNVNQFITVNIEHIPKFKGILGVSGSHQVVQIADVIKEKKSVE